MTVAALLLCANPVKPVHAQEGVTGGTVDPAVPGSIAESYLRYLQTTGSVAEYPWAIRPLSHRELGRITHDTARGPWGGVIPRWSGPRALQARVSVRSTFNSAFPALENDGAIWAGRGGTMAAEFAVSAHLGPLSLAIAPMAFATENRAYDLPAPLRDPALPLADPLFGHVVDLPLRYGSGRHARIDPGQSGLRLDLLGLTGGVSTANMVLGPMQEFPFVLGVAAPGFPHLFAGSSRPLDMRIARIHGRVFWGRLSQSPLSPVRGSERYSSLGEPGTIRFASGLGGVLQLAGMPGLELGITRFVHSPWPAEGLPPSYIRKPLARPFARSRGAGPNYLEVEDNQLASVFARFAPPGGGVEVYGEYGRDDFSWDLRDLLQQPDHARSYGLGFRKVVTSGQNRLTGIRGELINFQLPTVARGRDEGGIYVHTTLRQGHTHWGQPLGAPVGIGAASGFVAGWDTFTPSGMTAISWRRIVVREVGDFFESGRVNPRGSEVHHRLDVTRTRFLRGIHHTTGISVTRAFNRFFEGDVWNFSASMSVGLLRPAGAARVQ